MLRRHRHDTANLVNLLMLQIDLILKHTALDMVCWWWRMPAKNLGNRRY